MKIYYSKPIDTNQEYTEEGKSKMPDWWHSLPETPDKKWMYAMVQAGLAVTRRPIDVIG